MAYIVLYIIVGFITCRFACAFALKNIKPSDEEETVSFIKQLNILKYITEDEKKILIKKYRLLKLKSIAEKYFLLGHIQPEDIGFSMEDFIKREAIYGQNSYLEENIEMEQ